MEKLAVLDHESKGIYIYPIDSEDIDLDLFLSARGHDINLCSYMFSDNLVIYANQ